MKPRTAISTPPNNHNETLTARLRVYSSVNDIIEPGGEYFSKAFPVGMKAFRGSACKVGFSVTSSTRVGRRRQVTENPVFQALHHAGRLLSDETNLKCRLLTRKWGSEVSMSQLEERIALYAPVETGRALNGRAAQLVK
jgi:hypothetical protein